MKAQDRDDGISRDGGQVTRIRNVTDAQKSNSDCIRAPKAEKKAEYSPQNPNICVKNIALKLQRNTNTQANAF